jgi:SAM-dependent methyltransferase
VAKIGTPWIEAGTVNSFAQASANQTLMRVAGEAIGIGKRHLLDIGCGAGRNAVPLARQGWSVTGVDLSWPMLTAASERARIEHAGGALRLALASMDHLPVLSRSTDFIVAHGVWNLAASTAQFRRAVREAARAAKPGALLFVFTFSRTTLEDGALPVEGEEFVFTQFAGVPQCFLTAEQLTAELAREGFRRDSRVPLTEHNRPCPGTRRIGGPPVIHEGVFRYDER